MLLALSEEEKGLILVNGPNRSGKSELAEYLVKDHKFVTYIATSPEMEDEDWNLRVLIHKNRRPKHWNTIESPSDLIKTLQTLDDKQSILIDSLGSFVYQFIEQSNDNWINTSNKLIKTLKHTNKLIIIVIEETGWGIVPVTQIGNLFRDRLGSLSQQLEKLSSKTWLAVQGRAINLHQISQIIP